MTLLRSRSALAAATAALVLFLTACGADDVPSGSSASASTAPASSAAAAEPTEATSDEPFGEGCTAVPADGEGSFAGMADDPVATAASNTPALSSLFEAITAADLVDALDSAVDITVLAPADPAFEAVPADSLRALLADNARLSAVLTHHVIEGRLSPDQLAGEHTTLNGDTVTLEGSGAGVTVAAEGTLVGQSDAGVICGNVQTANATVYLIDQVLAPAAA